jgi:CHASE2 domain-containing sensor protein
VAQNFLQFFLVSYSGGIPLYTAVRQARDRLESLESRFPCATWLPVIYQNPAFLPPTWPSLQGTHPHFQQHQPSLYQKTVSIFGLGLGLTSIVLSMRFAGGFQLLELKAYDAFLRWTPEKIESDPDIVIVEITEEDLNIPEQQDRVDSLSPTALHKLLTILNQAKARVIGLNIYRDRAANFSTSRSFPPLQNWANTESPLITLCRIQDRATLKAEVSPPQSFPITSVGFSDQVTDPDGVVRRHLLAMKPEPGRCITPYSFSLQLALRYLAQDREHSDIPLKFLENGNWKIGQSTLVQLNQHEGAYHQIDSRGIQLILNYRGSPNQAENGSFQTVTLAQILHGQVADEVIKDRIVIIGTTAESYKDYHKTPFGQPISGVLLQAHMTSHLIDLALDRRSLIWTWPAWLDGLWIGLWTTIGVIFSIPPQNTRKTLRYLMLSLGAIMLITSSWTIFVILNGWIPLIPCLLGLTLAGLVTPKIVRILTR